MTNPLFDVSTSQDQKRILLAGTTLMAVVSVMVLSLALWMLYQSNFNGRVADLRAMIEGQVSLIDAVARFDRLHSTDVAGGSTDATLQQVVEGYSRLGGFGKTGEFVIGHRLGDQIEFLSEFRFQEAGARRVVPVDTDRAAPMRRALNNKSGWMIGLDYRGERVLAAYEPIHELEMGLVAKLDMSEVIAPFKAAAVTALGIACVTIILGSLLLLRIVRPVVRRIEQGQEHFRTLLESAPDAMVIVDSAGKIVMVNRRTEELFSYSREALEGEPIEILMPQRFRGGHIGHVRDFFQNSSARPMGAGLELYGISRDGREFPVEISLSPIRTEGGMQVAGSLRDITERKQAELKMIALNEDIEKQRKTETALNQLSRELRGQQHLDGLAHVIVGQLAHSLGRQFVALYVLQENETFRRVGAYGYPNAGGVDSFERGEGLLGQVAEDAVPHDVGEIPEYARLALGLGTVLPGSMLIYPLVHDESVLAVLELGGLKPLDEYQRNWLDKASDGLAVTIRLVLDLEQRSRIARELAVAKDLAEAANKAKSDFLANMSHELRTPMNAILGYSEMLMEEAEDIGQQEFIPDLEKINKAGNHLLALINDVLDLSKIESGRMEVFTEDIDLDSMIAEVVDTVAPLMKKNNNRVTVETSGELGHIIQDLTKLRQSLFNLLSNAAKFTHDGLVTLAADRTSEAGVEWLTISVTDTGIGISEDKLEHVFEEFSQADSSTTRNYGGTGLGLAISRRFCEMLGGGLSVSSKPGEGAKFTIRIPAVYGAKAQVEPVKNARLIEDEDLSANYKQDDENVVLVVDDDPEARDLVERFLRKDGFKVVTAASGKEGLSLAQSIRPMAITLDVMMGDMDGWSVLRQLRADPKLKDVPVVMLTMIDEKGKGYTLGATDYLTKPVDREQLHSTMRRYCETGQPGTVLLVEDEAETREMMSKTLGKSGWQVSEAGNGREALDCLEQEMPQLILLDLMMPEMDGFEFLDVVGDHAEWQDIPVIVLTAKDLTGEERKILDGRVKQIVEKGSCSRQNVVSMVRKVIETGAPGS